MQGASALHAGNKRAFHRSRATHRSVKFVRLPKLDGMVPLSWFWLRFLRTHAGRA